jgi:hypothetical protein
MKRILYLLIMLMVIFSSCQKDIVFVPGSGPGNGSGGGSGSGAGTSILSGTTWKIVASTSVIEDSGSSFDFDLFSLFLSCQKDNTVTYNANFTATSDEGATKCDPCLTSGTNWRQVELIER